jgi:hypothetical protein
MHTQMTPEQALTILSQATELVQANRQVHMQILAAIETLKPLVKPQGKPELKLEKSN